jgi:hypothetical protein
VPSRRERSSLQGGGRPPGYALDGDASTPAAATERDTDETCSGEEAGREPEPDDRWRIVTAAVGEVDGLGPERSAAGSWATSPGCGVASM